MRRERARRPDPRAALRRDRRAHPRLQHGLLEGEPATRSAASTRSSAIAGDDVDICWRLQDAGLDGRASAPAPSSGTTAATRVRGYLKQQFEYGKAEALLERKWPERYNRVGHLAWAGRVYGAPPAKVLGGRWKIYYGTWGTGPVPVRLPGAPGILGSLPLMPEWYLVIAAAWPASPRSGSVVAAAARAAAADRRRRGARLQGRARRRARERHAAAGSRLGRVRRMRAAHRPALPAPAGRPARRAPALRPLALAAALGAAPGPADPAHAQHLERAWRAPDERVRRARDGAAPHRRRGLLRRRLRALGPPRARRHARLDAAADGRRGARRRPPARAHPLLAAVLAHRRRRGARLRRARRRARRSTGAWVVAAVILGAAVAADPRVDDPGLRDRRRRPAHRARGRGDASTRSASSHRARRSPPPGPSRASTATASPRPSRSRTRTNGAPANGVTRAAATERALALPSSLNLTDAGSQRDGARGVQAAVSPEQSRFSRRPQTGEEVGRLGPVEDRSPRCFPYLRPYRKLVIVSLALTIARRGRRRSPSRGRSRS